MVESIGSEPQTCFLLCSVLFFENCQCRRVGYCVLGQEAYIARACYMTETDGVCLSCCPSASTPAVARLLVRYRRGSIAVGSPLGVRTGLRACGICGGEIERRCKYRLIDSKKLAARGRSRSGGPDFVLQTAFRGKASRTQAYQALRTKPWTSTIGNSNSITLHGTMGSDCYILLDVFTSRQGYGDLPITPHMSPRRWRPGMCPLYLYLR
jgi:hypothetical protein